MKKIEAHFSIEHALGNHDIPTVAKRETPDETLKALLGWGFIHELSIWKFPPLETLNEIEIARRKALITTILDAYKNQKAIDDRACVITGVDEHENEIIYSYPVKSGPLPQAKEYLVDVVSQGAVIYKFKLTGHH